MEKSTTINKIRTELEQLGYQFSSETDTEVVLYALEYWGPEALIRFNGMFALALTGPKEKSLLLARDRYGGINQFTMHNKVTNFYLDLNRKLLRQYQAFREN